MKEYICYTCNYGATSKSNLDKHLTTKKHKNQLASNQKCNCMHCGLLMLKKNIKRHIVHCVGEKESSSKKMKPYANMDINIKSLDMQNKDNDATEKAILKLQIEIKNREIEINAKNKEIEINAKNKEIEINAKNKEIEMKNKEIEMLKIKAERDVLKVKLETLEKNAGTTNINNGTIKQKTINKNYITKNFQNAYNFNVLMSPSPTEKDIEYACKRNNRRACVKAIQERCIDNMAIEMRPIHCIDLSRNKMLIRMDDVWHVDSDHQKLLGEAEKFMEKLEIGKNGGKKLNNTQKLNLANDYMKRESIYKDIIQDLSTRNVLLLDNKIAEKCVENKCNTNDVDNINYQSEFMYINDDSTASQEYNYELLSDDLRTLSEHDSELLSPGDDANID